MTNKVELFPHIAGYKNIKEEGKQIIEILSNPNEFISRGAYIPRGWFLYGDPGMGKTRFVKDIAEYLDYPIVEISSSEAIKRQITTEQMLVSGFEEAIKQKRCIIFLDELDKMCGYDKYEYDVPDNIQNQKILLHKLDEIKDMNGIVVFATANRRRILDDSVLRSGRFDRHIYFPNPAFGDRQDLITYFLGDIKIAEDITLFEMCKITGGNSCAEIESIVNEAKILMITNKKEKMDYESFNLAYNRINREDIPGENIAPSEKLKFLAYHEAGHCVVAYLLKPETIREVTLVRQGNGEGHLELDSDDVCVYTQQEIEDHIKIGLAGYLSEQTMTGTLTWGSGDDLYNAGDLVDDMIRNGFFGVKHGYGVGEYRSPQYYEEYTKLHSNLLEKYNEETKVLVENHKEEIEIIAQALMKDQKLTRKQIFELLEK